MTPSDTMLIASASHAGVLRTVVAPRRPWAFSCVPAMLRHLADVGDHVAGDDERAATMALQDYEAIRSEISEL